MHGGSSEGLEICIKTHSEALIILQTSKLKESIGLFKKNNKFLYTFFLLLRHTSTFFLVSTSV